MGLGKTIETRALMQRDWETNGKRPALLVCPMSVVGNWQKEAARFTPDLPVEELVSLLGGSVPADDLFGEVQVPPMPAALPKRLGNFPFWRSAERFLEAIEPVYVHASPRGLGAFLGERDPR